MSCHLGAGASLAAVRDGRSRRHDDGLHADGGTRHGHARRAASIPGSCCGCSAPGLDVDELEQGLEHESGLLGLAGDRRHARGPRARDDDDARLAIDVYVHRLRAAIAAMAAALGGLDALVFTGGVGEHAPRDPRPGRDGLGFLGVALDRSATHARRPTPRSGPPARLRAPSSSPRARTSRSPGAYATCSRDRRSRRKPHGCGGLECFDKVFTLPAGRVD